LKNVGHLASRRLKVKKMKIEGGSYLTGTSCILPLLQNLIVLFKQIYPEKVVFERLIVNSKKGAI